MQARLRTLGDSIRMESLQTIRSRDVQIAELKEQAHKLDAMLLLMLDRTVLEQVVRNERKQREEECQQAQRRLDAEDTEMRAKVAKIDELNQRLAMAEAKRR